VAGLRMAAAGGDCISGNSSGSSGGGGNWVPHEGLLLCQDPHGRVVHAAEVLLLV